MVDDEASVRKALTRVLRLGGCEVTPLETGAECLVTVETARPDCVVLDLNLPGVSGFDVLETLHARRCPTPVVVVTARDTPEVRARVMRAGARAFLTKPVEADALVSTVREAADAGPAHWPKVQ